MVLLSSTRVCFPGLGIGEFSLDRAAFSLFGKEIYWYAIFITLGMVVAFVYAYFRSKREGVLFDDIIDLALAVIFSGIVGARLYYVLTTLGTVKYDSFIDVIAIWNGGLAIYGGIIGGGIAAVVVCIIKGINPLKVLDMIAPGLMIAQAMGRWGNFVNGEAYGYAVPESSPLYVFRMGLVSDYTGLEMNYYHPTFLYESVWNIAGFVILSVLYGKKKFNGQIALMYLSWYGFGRMFIEGLRTDSLYVGPFRISQVVGFVCFFVCTTLLVIALVMQKKGRFGGKVGELLTVRWAEPGWEKKLAGEQAAETDDDIYDADGQEYGDSTDTDDRWQG